MFIEEEEWNDDLDAQILSKTVFSNTPTKNSSANVKVVGKKSLLRTLQTLSTEPEWKSEAPTQSVDSEDEDVHTPKVKKKRKKKRSKRKSNQGDTTEEKQENGETNQSVTRETVAPKKMKKEEKDGSQTERTRAIKEGKINNKRVKSNSAGMNAEKQTENTKLLNRKQWKNKMKNKRKCKNKYRSHEPVEDKDKAKTTEAEKKEDTMQPRSKKEDKGPARATSQTEVSQTERKAKKRKKSEEAAQPRTEGVKPEASEPEGSATDLPDPGKRRRETQLSREQNLKRDKLRRLLNAKDSEPEERGQEGDQASLPQQEATAPPQVPEALVDPSASLRSRMEQRLEAARFRYINEQLYTTSSGEARRMFVQDPEAFRVYHKGYTAQVQHWPSNPVDSIIAYIQQRSSSLVVADFGCGDCKIARSVKNRVHSFDLAAACDLVTVCDMAKVPLANHSVDIAVFCLSLMGTNLADFMAEANRVLKMGGVLKIAEVASRFNNVRSFLTTLANMGFKSVSKDTENSHFYMFDFTKTAERPQNVKKFGLQLKPCLYKKR